MTNQVDKTRKRIITTAKDIFTSRGFFDPQMKDIAGTVSISRSSLYRYFSDKSDLAIAIFEKVAEECIVKVRPQIDMILQNEVLTGRERLKEILLHGWLSPDLEEEFRFLAEFDAYFSGNRIPKNFKERLENILPVKNDDTIMHCLREGVRDGSICSDIDIHLTMVTILNTIRGLRQRIILRGDSLIEIHNNETDRVIPELIKILLKGLEA